MAPPGTRAPGLYDILDLEPPGGLRVGPGATSTRLRGCLQAPFVQHGGWANRVRFSPDGSRLAISGDHFVCIHEAESGRLLRRLRTGYRSDQGIAWGAGGRWLAFSTEEEVLLWDDRARRLVPLDPPVPRARAMAFSPAGDRLAMVCEDLGFRLIEPEEGRGLRLDPGPPPEVPRPPWRITQEAVAFSPCGSWVASLARRARLGTLEGRGVGPADAGPREAGEVCLRGGPDGETRRRVAMPVAAGEPFLVFLGVEPRPRQPGGEAPGVAVHVVDADPPLYLLAGMDRVGARVLADGRVLGVHRDRDTRRPEITLEDRVGGGCWSVPFETPGFDFPMDPAKDFDVHPRGRCFALAWRHGLVTVHPLEGPAAGQAAPALAAPLAPRARRLAVAPGGRRALWGDDQVLELLRLDQAGAPARVVRRRALQGTALWGLGFGPSADQVTLGLGRGLETLDLVRGRTLGVQPRVVRFARVAGLAPDLSRVAHVEVLEDRDRVHIHPLAAGTGRTGPAVSVDLPRGANPVPRDGFGGFHLAKLHFTPDAAALVVMHLDQLLVLDSASGERRGVMALPGGMGPLAAMSPAEPLLVALDPGIRRLVLVDLGALQVVGELAYGHDELPAAVFHPQGRGLAVADPDLGIRLYDLRERRQVGTLLGHEGVVRAMAFDPVSGDLLSAGDDRQLRRWELAGFPSSA